MTFDHTHHDDQNQRDDETDPFYQAVGVAIDKVEEAAPKGAGKTAKAHDEEIDRRINEAYGIVAL